MRFLGAARHIEPELQLLWTMTSAAVANTGVGTSERLIHTGSLKEKLDSADGLH